jgi:hypothetical protein
MEEYELDLFGSKQGLVLGRCEHNIELSCSIKEDKILNQLSYYWCLKNGPTQ